MGRRRSLLGLSALLGVAAVITAAAGAAGGGATGDTVDRSAVPAEVEAKAEVEAVEARQPESGAALAWRLKADAREKMARQAAENTAAFRAGADDYLGLRDERRGQVLTDAAWRQVEAMESADRRAADLIAALRAGAADGQVTAAERREVRAAEAAWDEAAGQLDQARAEYWEVWDWAVLDRGGGQ